MLNSISWQEFLNTALIAVGTYYVVSVLLFYSRELISGLKGTPQPDGADRETALMGQIRKETPKKHEHVAEAQDLVIDPSNTSKLDRSEEGLLINSVSHLLREVKVLARVIRESNGSKADAAPMFQSLLSNYSHLGETKFRESITLFVHDTIRQECAFETALQEIDGWWTEAQTNKSVQ